MTSHFITGRTDRSETVHQIMNHKFDIKKEQDGPPVKIRFDETS